MNYAPTKAFAVITMLCLSSLAMANEVIFQAGDEWIARDAQTQEYIIHYLGGDETLKTVRWAPTTNIAVSIASEFKVDGGKIRYQYKIKNHKTSKQPVIGFKVMARAGADGDLLAPEGWFGRVVENFDDRTGDIKLSWLAKSPLQIAAGDHQRGFSVINADLPAAGLAEAKGQISLLSFPDEGPTGALLEFIEQSGLMRQAMKGVPRLAAVPRIPVPTPWDTGTVLANIRTHINTDMVSMQLIDPVFANELNRLFTAAIEATKHNNDKGVKENLNNIRKALKKAHKDIDDDKKDNEDSDWESTEPKQKPKPATIDRLAARVLDFDVRYVLGRLGKDDKD